MALTPVFDDFDFRAHLARLAEVAHLTEELCPDEWELFLDGMQLLYDVWAAVGTSLAIPTVPQKDALLAISSQVVMALTSAGVLARCGDYQRSIVCTRQGYEELLHFIECVHDRNAAARYLRGQTQTPSSVRKAVEAPEFVRRQYAWLSRFAHGGIENALLMRGGGWMPLQTGQPNLRSARFALQTAIQVVAMAMAEFIAPFGRLESPWYARWVVGQSAFYERLGAQGPLSVRL